MSQRTERINELLRREISDQLHSRWRSESVRITVTAVEISTDLRDARIFYAVLGGNDEKTAARHFLARIVKTLRMSVAKRVILKYTPAYRFVEDRGAEEGVALLNRLDEIAAEDAARDARYGNADAKKTDAADVPANSSDTAKTDAPASSANGKPS